jgi:hypothetical protein
MYPKRDTRSSRRGWVCVSIAVGAWGAFHWDARAAPAAPAERTQAIVLEVEADPAARELVGPALERSKEASARAGAAAPPSATLLEVIALEWAEVARDLLRASSAEKASDRLEQEASALETESARLRAAVEQTMARVGRARQDLQELEKAGSSIGPSGGPAR